MPTNANAERPEWNYCHSRRSVHNVLEATAKEGGKEWGKSRVTGGSSKACLHMQRHTGVETTPSHKAGWAYGLHFTDINIYIS